MRMNRKEYWILILAMAGALSMHPALSAQPPVGIRLATFEQPVPAPPAPKVTFVLKDRHGHATPVRTRTAHTAGGNTDVAYEVDESNKNLKRTREDTLIITMTGVVTAGPHPGTATAADLAFDLNQDFEIAVADQAIKKAKLTLECQVIGLLRGDKNGGGASINNGSLVIASGNTSVLSLALEGHSVCGDDNLAINDRKGPVSVALPPGDYHLLQTFHISATHARSICGKAAAAEFAADPALDPTWISVTDPFRGANKKEFGFRVTLHVEPE